MSAQDQASARGDELGHAGLDVAAHAGFFQPRHALDQLTHHVLLDRHPGELAVDARKLDQRLAELDAFAGVGEAELEGVLRDAQRARRRLDTGEFEGGHQLAKALALLAAERARGRHLETVEAQLVFAHAAIAEHLDLAAGHALGRERIVLGAARLLGKEHRQAAMAAAGRAGARQQDHHVGARGVRDPGLCAVDAVDVADALGARGQVRQIRAVVRLGEHGGRQDFAGRKLRQQALLLLVGAGETNEFAGDFRARAERADADIAARQLLGDDAHRFRAHLRAAEGLRRGQAENAELAELGDCVDRNQLVVVVPGRRERRDLLVGERAELAADQRRGLVVGVAGIDHRSGSGLPQQRDQFRTRIDADRAQRADIRMVEKCARRVSARP